MTATPAPEAAADARPRVLLLFGGRSSEHPISCVTAAGVLHAADRQRWDVVPVGVARSGLWSHDELDVASFRLDGDALPEVPEPKAPVSLRALPDGTVELTAADGSSLGPVDVVFPLLHGPWGEDGTLQGMFESLGLPYVGCGVLASAVGMDKHFMKVAFQAAGLQVGPWETITARDWARDPEAALARAGALAYPLFVKPARAGSSFGITRVTEPAGLRAAVEEARRFDPKVVVEAGIVGREIECAVLDGHGAAAPRASLPGEIVVAHDEGETQFYDFESKYQDTGTTQLSCPAELPEEEIERLRALAIRAFEAVDGSGLGRCDFFFTPDGRWVVNEINTMPGFTPISMYPAMWERTGLSYDDLISELLDLALERGVGLH
ncbi:D-alanine--D-alanine ligase A [Micrococcus luteus]|jgi:D-alanine-D-alanine ligase|uniref:D-alanine--D-alanine ligase n=1 Tax=Micrococcus luteus (strain ATCC 4698 / DSM 20030 / JCM 1464 / CCM 169 / CCUG 5858 / IAM 1056 / NBRC 3333 / NCIMB 9278 / NCTC 2665 / VKM Ac-2230) TaxID=465515 RepID=C5CAD3_MICLC|nr:D-alanine--D-alanine ligase family protein [Micrococcus luteus]ACS30402.1 D-alanine--D-alanine ligase [Micrococcus luteus NCTC 2665]AJO55506.1 D-alanine--D-alanine ligase [Micrococcus luteus]KAB1901713.1 D-alanine--D-alanine ligase [Micrococcus luteus NCTC 2665]ORE62330.1 D-alanine--D-alanine ligase A [Micrococcus luteus]QCY45663.1 D-alanine--D-alanine ligase [Micrococcus luteus]